VTSRERLRIQGEQSYPVSPLAERDAVELFVIRARAIDPAFSPTPAMRELCGRLDQLPLPIELAAARAELFSAEQLLERVSQRLDLLQGGRDADPRQQTLRATIDWSYDLLAEDEKILFARLSVFVGGCTLEAAEQVTDADVDTLQWLLDKSLLRRTSDKDGRPRYWMLQTIREYATERLEESFSDMSIFRRHAEYVLALAESANLDFEAEGEQRHDLVMRERDNVHAALGWALRSDPELGLVSRSRSRNSGSRTNPSTECAGFRHCLRRRTKFLRGSPRAHSAPSVPRPTWPEIAGVPSASIRTVLRASGLSATTEALPSRSVALDS
jgi:predicted ATPase